MPLALVSTVNVTARNVGPVVFVFAVQAAVFPAFMSINAAATTFIQDKENQSLLPLLAAPIRDEQIVYGKALAVFVPSILAAFLSLGIYLAAASFRFGASAVFTVVQPPTFFALLVVSALFTLTIGSVGMIVASRVRSIRSAQQIAGILIAIVVVGIVAGGQYLTQFADGWLLVILPLGVLAADVVALELVRRLWGREEVIARI